MQETIAGLKQRCENGSIKYCFLNKIYSRESNPDVYEVAFSTEDFMQVWLYRTLELSELIDFKVAKDFGFDGDYMQCNPAVQVVAGDSIPENTIGSVMSWENKDTLFSFITNGCNNDYVILLDEVAEGEDNWSGYGVAYFTSIKASKSTMSIYIPMTSKDGLINKMIAVEDHSSLIMKPFYYGIPADLEFGTNGFGDFSSRKTINGIKYDVYRVQSLSLFLQTGVPVSAPLINQAAILNECYTFTLQGLQDILKEYAINEEPMEWAGGSHQYASASVIEIKPELPKITKTERGHILWACLHNAETAFCDDTRVKYLKAACKCLSFSDGEELPEINSIFSVMQYIRHKSVAVNMYLMTVRYYVYCSHRSVVPEGSPSYVSGGLLAGDTYIKEGF